jgi:hypothetical protein
MDKFVSVKQAHNTIILSDGFINNIDVIHIADCNPPPGMRPIVDIHVKSGNFNTEFKFSRKSADYFIQYLKDRMNGVNRTDTLILYDE